MRNLIALASLVILSGCGGGVEPPAPVFPVTGKVTYKQQPVVGADITFFNADASRSAFGRTNDQGEYQLTTFSSNDGAVEGKSVVTIAKFSAPAAPAPVASIESQDYVPPGVGQSTDPPKPSDDLPAKYASQETSGLIAVVNASGENKLDFNLE